MRSLVRCARGFLVLVGTFACFALGCGTLRPLPLAYEYFEAPAPDDPWSAKITRWQVRERAVGTPQQLAPDSEQVGAGPGEPAEPDVRSLRSKYFAFRASQRRAMARGLAAWMQDQARSHYVPDGSYDHWATLEETLARDGDDCDGLELMAYHFLRDLGFGDDRVYRAIVFRPMDGQHHMVTLWFEESGDPWVIDPTGAMTSGMPRMSQVPGWVPLKVFSETEEFNALPASTPAAASP
jgi:hypothetical protein